MTISINVFTHFDNVLATNAPADRAYQDIKLFFNRIQKTLRISLNAQLTYGKRLQQRI